MTINHIIIAGGAYNGMYIVGVFKKLIEVKFFDIDEIKTIYATSVGGLIGILLCLREDWDTIINYIIERPWDKDFIFTPDMMFQMLPNKGLLDNAFFKLFLNKLLKAKNLSQDITLQEFYAFSKIKLILFALDINNFNTVPISYESHPNMKLIEAVYITCSLPFIFQPTYIDDTYLIDGGVLYNYPLDFCIEHEEAEEKSILGVNFKVNTTNKAKIDHTTNIFHYGYHIIDKLVGKARIRNKNIISNQIIMDCDATEINTALIMLKDKAMRKKYIIKGETYAESFLTNLHSDKQL